MFFFITFQQCFCFLQKKYIHLPFLTSFMSLSLFFFQYNLLFLDHTLVIATFISFYLVEKQLKISCHKNLT